MWCEEFFSGPACLVFSMLLLLTQVSLSQSEKRFYGFIDDMFYAFELTLFSFYAHNSRS